MKLTKITLLLLAFLLIVPEVQADSHYQKQKKAAKKKKKKKRTAVSKKSDKNTKKKKVTKNKKKSLYTKHTKGFSLLTKVGIGYDSNPFLTPSNPYDDMTTGTAIPITPIVRGGWFTPLHLKSSYGKKLFKKFYSEVGINYKGRFFFDPSMKNADDYTVIFDLLNTYYFEKYSKKKSGIQLRLFYDDHYEIYVDHDNGDFKNTRVDGSGTEIENRYQFQSFGGEVNLFRYFKKLKLDWRTHLEELDYATPLKWSELDHKYFFTKLDIEYKTSKKFTTAFMYRYVNRNYYFRPSFFYDDTQIKLTSNTGFILVPLNYTFHDIKVAEQYKINGKFSTKLTYFYSDRKDDYLGYGNSKFHRIELRSDYKHSKKLTGYLKGALGSRTYDVALAYDEIGQPKKYYNSSLIHLGIKHKLMKKLDLIGDIHFNNQRSSDKRYEYDHFVSTVSVKYKY